MDSIFEPGSNCWRVERADRASVLVDGENFFRAVRQAMAKAQSRIVMAGWDFDARIKMYDTQEEPEGPLEIGRYIDWLIDRNPDLHIYILRWDYGAIKSIFRGKTIFTMLRWLLHPRIHLELDQKHPAGAAQHQKVVAIDDNTAFCGGIDLTEDRWDTRTHDEEQEYRCQPGDEDAGPWHDASMAMQGPVAKALAEFCEMRWDAAGGKTMRDADSGNDCWPDGLEADFSDIDIAIARTQAKLDDQDEVTEIEELYEDMIDCARNHIYAESQYLASRTIAAAIAKRLEEENGPEIVIVNPCTAEGWLESKMMDTTRARLVAALMEHDPHDRLRVYHPVNEAGSEIYVHAKILIIDDRLIKIGSSNMNNRSLGFDTECDVAIDAGDDARSQAAIARIRNELLAEHLDGDLAEIEARMRETGSLIETIQLGRKTGRTFRDYQFPELSAAEEWAGEHDLFNAERADDEYAAVDKPF
ncbi:MAG: phospholipase [Sphingomonadaceae bacterium]|nr:phospholipase [Sphingomonadaceae bacterium]